MILLELHLVIALLTLTFFFIRWILKPIREDVRGKKGMSSRAKSDNSPSRN